MILRCTRKLLTAIGPSAEVEQLPVPDDEDWYANLLRLDHRTCLLLTHAATLFTALQVNIRVAELRPPRQLVLGLIEQELHREGLPADAFGDLSTGTVRLTTTADRSILGCMNDMAALCEMVIAQSGGLAHTNVADLNTRLRRNINSTRGYRSPIDLTAERLGGPRQP